MEIKGFKAYRFDEAKVGKAGDCIAPPYDVVNAEQQEQLYQKNEYNIIRVTKGKTESSDSETSNQYTRAADFFDKWIKEGILKQDNAEAIYAYVQDFEIGGQKIQRPSFIALAKLEEFGKIVRPHEQTLSKPKVDRLNLQRATAAAFGLVFMLYEDKKKVADRIIETAMEQKPLIDFFDENNVHHRLFAIKRQDDVNAIAGMMADKSCIIADGHHRYETGLNYYKETGKPTAAYQMIAFTNTCNPGLIILPTHRLVGNLIDFKQDKFFELLGKDFTIEKYSFDSAGTKSAAKEKMLKEMKAQFDKDNNALGIYCGDDAFYAAVLKNKKAMDEMVPNMSAAWKSLDVSVLHKLILEKLLDIDEKRLAGESNVEYIKDTDVAIDESIAKVDDGKKQAAFFMNPTKIEQVKAVTDAGEKMPQKSTFFYPKMYTGLTINKF